MGQIRNNLKHLRESRNLSQGELAQALNISPSMVGMIERGERMPSLQLLLRITKFFNAPLSEIFDFAQEEETVNA